MMKEMLSKGFGQSPELAVMGFAIIPALLLSGCGTSGGAHHIYHPEVFVPDGQEHAFSLFAEGVQIYFWTGTNWSFRAPEAELYDGDRQHVGKHYKGTNGPTWEATDGSRVVASVVTNANAYNAHSIPHLLLKAVSSSDEGTISRVTYIQRVDTLGGMAPAEPGKTVEQEARVKYSAEYAFYRKTP